MSLSSLADILPSAKFFRCQKSFIVNLTKIEGIAGNKLIMGSDIKIPISKKLKHELIQMIDKNNLI